MDEKEIVVTYDTLFDLTRRERYRAELQKLDNNFFIDVVKYLNEKQTILKSQENKESVFSSSESEKTRVQIVNAKKILKDLYERREAKIIQMALFHSRNSEKQPDFNFMLQEEINLFKTIEKKLSEFRKNILHKLLFHECPKCPKCAEKPKDLKIGEGKEEQGNLICFNCEMPEFVGPDMKTYGPFKQGDKVELPENIADMLMNNGHAVKE
ncbi:MAG: hypothetical protein KKA65_04185 [Nanoarchaeota archaeon]|nr:hypothetical protein [Nanoarchaeota archaeon]MBU4456676.1 hypothetical protein [Nanoarchaeota archaeon]MCG2719442.1 hypothetical protein [Nanoarchaeota archaeon]